MENRNVVEAECNMENSELIKFVVSTGVTNTTVDATTNITTDISNVTNANSINQVRPIEILYCDPEKAPDSDLGKGSYGEVYFDVKGNAVKIFSEPVDNYLEYSTSSFREITHMLTIQDEKTDIPVVPKIHSIVMGNSFGFTMDKYVCSLNNLLRKPTDQTISKAHTECLDYLVTNLDYFVFKLVYVLAIAQSKSIVHRDVKPCNILIGKNYDIILADWGLSYTKSKVPLVNEFDCEVVTIWYRCPEELLKIYDYCSSYSIDMWSIGIIMLEMLDGRSGLIGRDDEVKSLARIVKLLGFPKDPMTVKAIHNMITKNKVINFPTGSPNTDIIKYICQRIDKLPPFCESFIVACLKWSPNDRITPMQALNHPFLSGFSDTKTLLHYKLTTQNDFTRMIDSIGLGAISYDNIVGNNDWYFFGKPNVLLGEHLTYRDKYVWCYFNFSGSLQIRTLCVMYTDKLMELGPITSTNGNKLESFDINLVCAVYAIVARIFGDQYIEIEDFKKCYKTNDITNEHITFYFKQIIIKFGCYFPTKSCASFQYFLLHMPHQIKHFYRVICTDIMVSGKYIGYMENDLFFVIIDIIKKYCYRSDKNRSKIITFDCYMKNIETFKHSYIERNKILYAQNDLTTSDSTTSSVSAVLSNLETDDIFTIKAIDYIDGPEKGIIFMKD